MSFKSMGITAADVNKALDRVKRGRFDRNYGPSLNTYIFYPVDKKLWDLKPVVSVILEGVDAKDKPREWITTTFEPDLLTLGFRVIKFDSQKKRTLGIRGFDNTKSYDDHTLLQPPDGAKIKNGLREIINGLETDESVSNAQGTPTSQVSTKRFDRTRSFVQKILKDANGYCSACGNRAFRKRSGDWFLEVHHKNWLREGGADAEANMIALCPNCHRQEHHGDKRRYY